MVISGIEPLTSWMPFKRSPSWAIPPYSIPRHFLPNFTRKFLILNVDFQTFSWISKFQICLIIWLSLGLLTRLCALPAELYPRIQFPQKFFELPKSISSIFSFNRAYFRTNHPICQLANFAEFWPDSKFPLGTFTGVLGLPAELCPTFPVGWRESLLRPQSEQNHSGKAKGFK